MVVRRAAIIGGRAYDCSSVARAMFALLALIGAVMPIEARSDNLSPIKQLGRTSLFGHAGDAAGLASPSQVFDPAAAAFSSLLSYGAMSVIAPIVYGNFFSPTAQSSVPGYGGPMGQNVGFDPAVSTMLNGTFQEALLQAGGPEEVEAFSVGSGDAVIASSDAGVPSTVGAGASSGNSVAAGAAATLLAINPPGGIPPACTDDETERALQAGGTFWNPHSISASPAQFPGDLTSGVNMQNPLGDLGPSGNPTNLSPPGPAGSWCRPPATPFYETSPLENTMTWIVVGLLFGGLLVFYLSRGVSLPA